jgi:hypothetical protein
MEPFYHLYDSSNREYISYLGPTGPNTGKFNLVNPRYTELERLIDITTDDKLYAELTEEFKKTPETKEFELIWQEKVDVHYAFRD